jgi:hypothetical protein
LLYQIYSEKRSGLRSRSRNSKIEREKRERERYYNLI